MKKILVLVFLLIAIYANAQFPKGTPYPYSVGWSRTGYYQADSAIIVGLRDTSWSARFIGSMVFYRTPTDTSLYIWNGQRWASVAGTQTPPSPINPDDFIKNQYASKQSAKYWIDSSKTTKAYIDSIFTYNTVGRYVKSYWADTTNYKIEINTDMPNTVKNITIAAPNQVFLSGYQATCNAANGFFTNSLVATTGGLGYVEFVNSTFKPFRYSYPVYAYANGTDISIIAGAPVQGAGATNYNGGTATISGGTSTGTGTSQIIFKTASAGSSGNVDNIPSIKMVIKGNGIVNLSSIPDYADNAAATAAGLTYGDIYQTSGALKIVY